MKTAPCVIGIVTWNNLRFLPGLKANLAGLAVRPLKILIYDNGSTDGSAAWVRENWPEAALFTGSENLGFAEANNQLIEAGFADRAVTAYLALNSDALLEPDFFETVMPSLESAQKTGAVQPLVLRLDDSMKPTGKIDTTGIIWNPHDGLFLDRHAGEPVEHAPQMTGPVFGPNAAVAVYSRECLESVWEPHGWFDRRFFAYYEDVDLAWRMRRAGWETVFIPSAKAYHRRYGSSRSGQEQEKLLYRNRLWLHLKNEGRPPLGSLRAVAREVACVGRAFTTRPYLKSALEERFSRYREFSGEFDPASPKINLSEFAS